MSDVAMSFLAVIMIFMAGYCVRRVMEKAGQDEDK